jgi:hypothetical protein
MLAEVEDDKTDYAAIRCAALEYVVVDLFEHGRRILVKHFQVIALSIIPYF